MTWKIYNLLCGGRKVLCTQRSPGEARKAKHTRASSKGKRYLTCLPLGRLGKDIVYSLAILRLLMSQALPVSPRIYVYLSQALSPYAPRS